MKENTMSESIQIDITKTKPIIDCHKHNIKKKTHTHTFVIHRIGPEYQSGQENDLKSNSIY